jgi:hypothetical protein
MDATDRGLPPKPSALTRSSEQPLPDWWTLLTAQLARLEKLLPAKGQTAEMIAARMKTGGQFLARRYASRTAAEVVGALEAVVDSMGADKQYSEFPPSGVIVDRIDRWLMPAAGQQQRSELHQRRLLTEERDRQERARRDAEIRRQYTTDPQYRALVDQARDRKAPLVLASALRRMAPPSSTS